MDRRGFLRLLGGAAVTAVAAPTITHVLPPLGGWHQGQSGLYASNGRCVSPDWAHKTPAEILADVNAMLAQTIALTAPDNPDNLWMRPDLYWAMRNGAPGMKRLRRGPMQNRKATDVQLYGV
jgi:hypothetical protein